MRQLTFILIISFSLLSCSQNNQKQKELELKEKELALKEKEIQLKEKELTLTPTQVVESLTKKSDTIQDIHKDIVPSAINFQGTYRNISSFSTANNQYAEVEELKVTKLSDNEYKWTYKITGYQTFFLLYGTGKANGNSVEFYLVGLKDGSYAGINDIRKDVPYLILKKENNTILTKWNEDKEFKKHFKKV